MRGPACDEAAAHDLVRKSEQNRVVIQTHRSYLHLYSQRNVDPMDLSVAIEDMYDDRRTDIPWVSARCKDLHPGY